uniref:Transmembrane protein n=1 Tax=Chromera velia CCMP2878 TaxID=1169474 RepID=A0A0G4HK42_9ALVE|eukprot:Cvel_7164.t1-p1 / transcript=Cvel_7164.t1 / gene=Cvel_7164 / organism=Chromera_velia_CCMP2878 / gene_product=hypothetical protein / transcript_product=hypothetical protein / location=Cvel_scaffold368:83055-86133(-) / protein_length=263 / sequence_SO=supercontig / SO=protein_coding / is_pseudo=false
MSCTAAFASLFRLVSLCALCSLGFCFLVPGVSGKDSTVRGLRSLRPVTFASRPVGGLGSLRTGPSAWPLRKEAQAVEPACRLLLVSGGGEGETSLGSYSMNATAVASVEDTDGAPLSGGMKGRAKRDPKVQAALASLNLEDDINEEFLEDKEGVPAFYRAMRKADELQAAGWTPKEGDVDLKAIKRGIQEDAKKAKQFKKDVERFLVETPRWKLLSYAAILSVFLREEGRGDVEDLASEEFFRCWWPYNSEPVQVACINLGSP